MIWFFRWQYLWVAWLLRVTSLIGDAREIGSASHRHGRKEYGLFRRIDRHWPVIDAVVFGFQVIEAISVSGKYGACEYTIHH